MSAALRARVARIPAQKPTYVPVLTQESDVTWTCPSERFTYVLYTLRLQDDGAITCDCMAGSWGRPCKHARALNALLTAAAQAVTVRAPRPRPTFHTCSQCGVTFWGYVGQEWCSCRTSPVQVPIDLAARRAERPAFVPAIPEFSEMYG